MGFGPMPELAEVSEERGGRDGVVVFEEGPDARRRGAFLEEAGVYLAIEASGHEEQALVCSREQVKGSRVK